MSDAFPVGVLVAQSEDARAALCGPELLDLLVDTLLLVHNSSGGKDLLASLKRRGQPGNA